jgi:hypothetical protein
VEFKFKTTKKIYREKKNQHSQLSTYLSCHPTSRYHSELVDILNQINTTRIQAIIQKLTTFGTRHTLSSQTDPIRGIGAARDWIATEMRAIAAISNGRMTVTL